MTGAAAGPALTALEALLRVQDIAAFSKLLVRVYERIDVDPAHRREALARVYFIRGFLDSAAEEWIEAYRSSPSAGALVGLAQVAVARGMVEEAHHFAHEAVALDPADPRAARLVASLAERHPLTGPQNAGSRNTRSRNAELCR